jgi:glycopeptide antibiotics resistance protein
MKLTSKWLNEKKHITANLISLTGLLSWEFLQTITIRGHFDWNDVLWTMIGALVFQLIWIVSPIRYKEKDNEA